VLRLTITDDTHVDLHLTGLTALLARRRRVRLPRERILKAFVLGRSFARTASPRLPCPGWATHRSRTGVFGAGDCAQLWSTGSSPVVLALYLRGRPFHRIVCEVEEPIALAAAINRWLRHGSVAPRLPGRPGVQPAAAP
jgi:hypothetical protein